jgi:glycerophosphoryl diester phosphodiesterase/hydroxymethylpyrimidine pyrophosphatase-like HAD family hydrolase
MKVIRSLIMGAASAALLFVTSAMTIAAQPKVMSHRGFYAHQGSYENTITSLKGAQQLGVEAVELDAHLTTDDSLMVLHGPKIVGTNYNIQQIDYKTAKSCVLPNGDHIPSLREYFTQAKKTQALTLFLELKSHSTPERETQLVEKVLDLARRMNMIDQTVFISFSMHACDEVLRLQPGARVIPITSSKTVPTAQQLKDKGYWGISTYFGVLKDRPELLDDAHNLGLVTVLWPVNDYDLTDYAIRHNVTYVSTDHPDSMKPLLDAVRGMKWKAQKKLICFDLDGTLTQHKTQLTPANKAVLDTLKTKYEVIMVGAGNCPRIYNQMNDYPITIVGNYGMQESQIVNGEFKIVRDDKIEPDRKFFEKNCNYLRKKYGYTQYKGDPLEFHESGMVTFGLLGTKADIADKIIFDPDRAKRRAMYPEVLKIFKDYAVYIGGSSSFDFAPKQYNKFDAVMRYAKEHGYTEDQVLFVGDDFADGGGDSHIRIYGMDYIQIDDYTKLPEKLKILF